MKTLKLLLLIAGLILMGINIFGLFKSMKNPGIYTEKPKDPYTTDRLVEIYGKEGNHIYTMNNSFESFAYIAIRILPFLFFLPYFLGFIKLKKNQENRIINPVNHNIS